MRRLPPLNAVRAFEAAARHLSFTHAAEELNVTQAAISHQVKSLEDRLGVLLFRRMNRALVLTEAGQTYLGPIRDALDRIADATERLTEGDRTGVLTISTMPSFAAKWLVPRLHRFQAAHPELEVRLSTTFTLVDFSKSDVDLAVRFGRGPWPGVRAERLMTEDVFPVCSPALLQGRHPLNVPDDLRHHTLLHDDFLIEWPMWLRAVGATEVDATKGPRFTDSAIVLQLAIDGRGVALSRRVLAANDLASGRLVRPFKGSLPSDYSYYIVAPPAAFARPKVAAFRDWLLAEAAADEDDPTLSP